MWTFAARAATFATHLTTANALLHSTLPDTHAIADTLTTIINRVPPDGVIPDAHPDTPRPKRGSGPDPMRRPRDEFPDLYDTTHASTPYRPHPGCPHSSPTSPSTPNTEPPTPPTSPPAANKPSEPSSANPSRPSAPTQKLSTRPSPTGTATTTFTGEYLDHHALNSAADHPAGRPTMTGVPGATWLATMALPLLRHTGNGRHAATTGWHRHNRHHYLIWPLWTPRLTTTAVQTLLEHPALIPTPANPRPTPDTLSALGILTIVTAHRQSTPGAKSAGTLTPTTH